MAPPAPARRAATLSVAGLVVSLTLISLTVSAEPAPLFAAIPPPAAGEQPLRALIGLLPALACLAAVLSCTFSFILWRRVGTEQEAAKSSLYAAGKLFDSAARRFSHAQDEAGSAVETASGAAGQAGQAAARLAAAVREAEARLSACVGEGEARLHAAASMLAQHEAAAANLPNQLAAAGRAIATIAVPAIEEATASLRAGAEASSAKLLSELRVLPALIAETIEAADLRAVSALQEAKSALQTHIAHMAASAGALPLAGAALGEAASALAESQARQTGLLGRVEALAGVLPGIATSLASTAAGQRQLLSQGRLGVDSGVQELRHAASCLTACVDEAASLMRARGTGGWAAAPSPASPAAPSALMHPALRPRDLSSSALPDSAVRRHAAEDVAQPG